MFDFKQIQRMQKELQSKFQQMQEEMNELIEDGSSGGGMVTVKVNGNNQIVSVKIAKDAVDPDDIEMLEDLILAAANNALEKVSKAKESNINKLTGGINLPGMPFL